MVRLVFPVFKDGDRVMAFQRRPRPNPWAWGCGALDGKDFAGMILDYPDGPSGIMGVPIRGRQKSQRQKKEMQWQAQGGVECFEHRGRAMSQGEWAPLEAGKGLKADFPLGPPEWVRVCSSNRELRQMSTWNLGVRLTWVSCLSASFIGLESPG